MRRQIFRFLTPLLLLLLAGCAGKGAPVHSGVPCQDVLTLPQDLAVYAVSSGNERMLATPSEQDMASQRQKHSLFRPWRMTKASVWVKQSLDKNFNMRPEKGFAGDERPFPADLWRELEANSNKEGYPSREGPAITLRHTSLRAMPTRERYYLNPDLPGEGYPFDYFQLSSIPVGAPLYICNVSRDGQWLLVESSITAGWLPAADAAPVDEVFMERWQDLPLAALVKDGVMIGGDAAHIGTLLPLPGPAPQGRGHALSVYYPAREGSGPAVH